MVCVKHKMIDKLGAHDRKKILIESLTGFNVELWGGFSPDPRKIINSEDQKRIVGGYVSTINKMIGGHQYPFFVEFPDNIDPSLPRLHAHFVIVSDKTIPTEVYRKARTKKYGYFMVKRYDANQGGIVYMYSGHKELRFGDIFCRNGRKCREKWKHKRFHDELHRIYNR